MVTTSEQELLEKLQDLIDRHLDDEDYRYGICEAYNLVADHFQNTYHAGDIYWVVMENPITKERYVQKLKLYRINQTSQKTAYCFTDRLRAVGANLDHVLTLSSPRSMKLRVYKTEEEAQRNINIAFTNRGG